MMQKEMNKTPLALNNQLEEIHEEESKNENIGPDGVDFIKQ